MAKVVGGFLRNLGLGVVAVLFVACTETASGPELDPPGLTQATPAVAFEPVTGIPEERTAVLAEALVSGAVSRGIIVVPREADDALYRVKGYFSAARAGTVTQVTFAWDIFDRTEARVHRIAGTESIPATVPDPWRAVTDDALRRVASRTVHELHGWLADRAATGTRTSETAQPPQGSGVAALLANGNVPVGTGSRGGPSVYLGAVEGAGPEGAAALTRALSSQLAAFGIVSAPTPTEADFLVTGEATIGPVHNDAQTVAVIWSVARAGGEGLGTVRQVRRLAAGTLQSGWQAPAREAAGAAAPGLVSLIQGS